MPTSLNWAGSPWESAARPPPGRASSCLTARPARICQARRLPRCRDRAPCFPASCAREAAARLSGCPFSYLSMPPWSVASNACHRPSYQVQHSRPENGRSGHTAASTGAAAFGPGWERGTRCSGFECRQATLGSRFGSARRSRIAPDGPSSFERWSRAVTDPTADADIVDLQPHEIAPSEFAVDRKVEQG